MRSWRAIGATLAGALGLAACAHVAPTASSPQAPPTAAAEPAAPRVVRVPVPTAVKCVPETLGQPPAYPDTDQALRDAGGAADRYQLLAAGRLLREERLKRLEEVVRKCRAAGR